ncbi:DUF159-domain-containing protein [Hymenopellis radicata]|nr:DUF159-domain-containing protein [Hymenopellis radicata]
MCGRFALHLAHRDIQEQLAAQEWINQDQFVPRYNVAPRSQAPVLRRSQPSGSGSASSEASSSTNAGDAPLVLHTMKWGLVPHWSKFEDLKMNTTNARAENLVEGTGMWNSIKGRNRCAVLLRMASKGQDKLPHLTRHKSGNRLMLMAGLYDSVVLEGQTERLWTFTIVTTEANKDFQWLHERQPVILSNPDALNAWLDTTSKKWDDKLCKLLEPYSDRKSPLECYKVPKEVGKVGTESSTFIQPIEKRKDGIEAMFAKQKTKPVSSATTSRSPIKANDHKRKKPASVSTPSKPAASSKAEDDAHSDDEVLIVDAPPAKKKKRS